MFDLEYDTIKTIVTAILLLSVFFFADLLAVVIVAATLTGLAATQLRRTTPEPQEQRWRRGRNWW